MSAGGSFSEPLKTWSALPVRFSLVALSRVGSREPAPAASDLTGHPVLLSGSLRGSGCRWAKGTWSALQAAAHQPGRSTSSWVETIRTMQTTRIPPSPVPSEAWTPPKPPLCLGAHTDVPVGPTPLSALTSTCFSVTGSWQTYCFAPWFLFPPQVLVFQGVVSSCFFCSVL